MADHLTTSEKGVPRWNFRLTSVKLAATEAPALPPELAEQVQQYLRQQHAA